MHTHKRAQRIHTHSRMNVQCRPKQSQSSRYLQVSSDATLDSNIIKLKQQKLTNTQKSKSNYLIEMIIPNLQNIIKGWKTEAQYLLKDKYRARTVENAQLRTDLCVCTYTHAYIQPEDEGSCLLWKERGKIYTFIFIHLYTCTICI